MESQVETLMHLLFRIYNQLIEATIMGRSRAPRVLDIKAIAIAFEQQKMCSLTIAGRVRRD